MKGWSRRDFIRAAVTIPALLFVQRGIAGSLPKNKCESRAILDEGLHWTTPDGAKKVCQRIAAAGFNVFVPCVWHGRGTTWPSRLAGWDDRLYALVKGHPTYDPLKILLHEAEKYGIEIHPWFTVGLRDHDFLPEFARFGGGKSFDFYNDRFRDFIVEIVLQVVRKYPVHGVNLDYVRFGGPRPGYETEREQLVGDVVRRISVEAKRVRPSLVISVDAAPWEPSMKQFGQDSVKWADEGLVDVIYSMQYQEQPDFDFAEQIMRGMRRPEAFVVMVGNFDRVGTERRVVPRDPDHLVRLFEHARRLSKGNGLAVYYYGMLSDAQIATLRSKLFMNSALPCWVRA